MMVLHRIPLNSSNLLRLKLLCDVEAAIGKNFRRDGAAMRITKAWFSSGHSLSSPANVGPGSLMRNSKFPRDKSLKVPERSYLEEVLLDQKDDGPKTTAQKVKTSVENTFFYLVGAASIAAIISIGYMFVQAFWAPDSPQQLYSTALKLIRADDRCIEIFGSSVAAFGEDNGRGRRRYISNKRYTTRDGQERLRVVFHLKGNGKIGRATAEIAKFDGSWDYRFLLVETEELVPETIILIDNRH